MENNEQHLEALKDIRQMMKQSNKFLSLSGLSGIFAGVYALIGTYAGYMILRGYMLEMYDGGSARADYFQTMLYCALVCLAVLLLSIVTALIFSSRKAKRNGYKLFDHTALRLMLNMLIPLLAGGVFCLALLYHDGNFVGLVCPAMLIFYGLALVNGSKYTLNDIRYLGCVEILLGLAACFYMGYGLIFWALGFGVLHIIYGTYMWFKYDRKY
jgi:hypothetical protein